MAINILTILEKSKKVGFQLLLGFLINLISWLYIYYSIQPTSEEVPLHYSVVYGPDYIDKGTFIYIIPFTGLVVLIVNYILYRTMRDKDLFASRMLIFGASLVQVFVFLSLAYLRSVTIV